MAKIQKRNSYYQLSHARTIYTRTIKADGTALQQVEVPEFLQNSLRYDVEVTHLTIIDKIERIMQARGITTYKLAQISGVNRQTIDNALAEDGNPTLSTLNSMCDALGYTLEIVEKK